MGTFTVEVEIGGMDQTRFETVRALVDTGAPYTLMPKSLLRSLGIRAVDTQEFAAASGEPIERDVGLAAVRLDGRLRVTPVVFSGEDQLPLLGAVTLQEFSLVIDTLCERLLPVSALALGYRYPDGLDDRGASSRC